MNRILIAVALSGLLAGCASTRSDLVKSGYLSLQPTSTAALTHSPSVYERNGGLVVDGWLDASEVIKGGHVDIQVISPDGTVVFDAAVNFRQPTSRTPTGPRGSSRGSRSQADSHATYLVQFPGLPPKGSVIRVVHDTQPHHSEPSE